MAILATATAPAAIRDFLQSAANAVDADLDRRLAIDKELSPEDPQRVLMEAMRYAVLGGGKRLRPALTIASARAVTDSNGEASPLDVEADAIAAAAAVELLHAYTLVHDDLPAMDDDEVRRGRPTVHVKYSEATAILAGDALLTAAFASLAELGPRCAPAVSALARAAGPAQLLGGQALDLALENDPSPSLEKVERVHRGKTGALFGAAAELGAIAAAASPESILAMREYGCALGVAFQHADDLDDGELTQLADHATRRRLELGQQAVAALSSFGERGELLAELARWVGGIGVH